MVPAAIVLLGEGHQMKILTVRYRDGGVLRVWQYRAGKWRLRP